MTSIFTCSIRLFSLETVKQSDLTRIFNWFIKHGHVCIWEMLGAYLFVSLPFGTIHIFRTDNTSTLEMHKKMSSYIVSVVICPKYFLPALPFCYVIVTSLFFDNFKRTSSLPLI